MDKGNKVKVMKIRAKTTNMSKRHSKARNEMMPIRKDSSYNGTNSSEVIMNFGPKYTNDMNKEKPMNKSGYDKYTNLQYGISRHNKVIRPKNSDNEKFVRRVIFKNSSLEHSSNMNLDDGESHQFRNSTEDREGRDSSTIRLRKMIACKKLNSKKMPDMMNKLKPYFNSRQAAPSFMAIRKSRDNKSQESGNEKSNNEENKENDAQEITPLKERPKPSTSQVEHLLTYSGKSNKGYARSFATGKIKFKGINVNKAKGMLQKLRVSKIDSNKIKPVRAYLKRDKNFKSVKRGGGENREMNSPYVDIRAQKGETLNESKIKLKETNNDFSKQISEEYIPSGKREQRWKSNLRARGVKSSYRPKRITKNQDLTNVRDGSVMKNSRLNNLGKNNSKETNSQKMQPRSITYQPSVIRRREGNQLKVVDIRSEMIQNIKRRRQEDTTGPKPIKVERTVSNAKGIRKIQIRDQ
ncbi:unnamed protein product [Moneuplotes crassus]|uniref:Uncharacterized protein n=1 Tax=Euplotes crassus TaxID=5936 RepID=A0AAD1U8V9_EUPCR|nr:unnamed protein product [Moneuplotes crassus]